MTNKTLTKNPVDESKKVDPPREEIQTAYQVHTLAHMLYGQLAQKYSWTAPPSPGVFEQGIGYPTPHWPQGWPRT